MTRLGEIFLNTGHIYISTKGYISIEIYSSDQMICDYVARMIGGSVHSHMRIRKVIIHKRSLLVLASQQLLKHVCNDEVEEQLRLVLEYATAETKANRDDVISNLRKLLTKEN